MRNKLKGGEGRNLKKLISTEKCANPTSLFPLLTLLEQCKGVSRRAQCLVVFENRLVTSLGKSQVFPDGVMHRLISYFSSVIDFI